MKDYLYRLREDLKLAAETFRKYEDHHRKRITPYGWADKDAARKAMENGLLAERFEKTLREAPEPAKESVDNTLLVAEINSLVLEYGEACYSVGNSSEKFVPAPKTLVHRCEALRVNINERMLALADKCAQPVFGKTPSLPPGWELGRRPTQNPAHGACISVTPPTAIKGCCKSFVYSNWEGANCAVVYAFLDSILKQIEASDEDTKASAQQRRRFFRPSSAGEFREVNRPTPGPDGGMPLEYFFPPSYSHHDLYTSADKDRPDAICDSDGEVVLGLCKRCGKGEMELKEPCEPRRDELAQSPPPFDSLEEAQMADRARAKEPDGAPSRKLADMLSDALRYADKVGLVFRMDRRSLKPYAQGNHAPVLEIWEGRKRTTSEWMSVDVGPLPEASRGDLPPPPTSERILLSTTPTLKRFEEDFAQALEEEQKTAAPELDPAWQERADKLVPWARAQDDGPDYGSGS